MCSNADPNRYQCGGGLVTDNVNTLKKSRPFQTVEKICSALMAILFLLFNALYWPWLLREGDFDYEKFEKNVAGSVFTGSQWFSWWQATRKSRKSWIRDKMELSQHVSLSDMLGLWVTILYVIDINNGTSDKITYNIIK